MFKINLTQIRCTQWLPENSFSGKKKISPAKAKVLGFFFLKMNFVIKPKDLIQSGVLYFAIRFFFFFLTSVETRGRVKKENIELHFLVLK